MRRPLDWAPLAGADPLAGDPAEIAVEAARLKDMAAELTWQVKTLKGIGADELLVGGYAEELRASATDVASKLEKVIHRYTEAARCLRGWGPELATFQDATLKLLLQAQDVERAAGRDIHSDLMTPGLAAFQQFHATGAGDAPAALASLSRALQQVLEEAEARGRFWADQIARAIDDELTDGFWDHVHGWVQNHKEMWEKYTDRLGWVATVAAVGALAVPGLNVAVLGVGLLDVVAIGSAGTMLASHTAMAAEGEGSWWDVGVDAAGLASFGYGRFVSKGLGRAAAAAEQAGADATGRAAAERFTALTREQAGRVMADPAASMADRQAARQSIAHLGRDAARVGDEAVQATLEAPEAEAGVFGRLLAGSKEDADAVKGANELLAEHPGDPAVRDAAAEVRRLAAKGRRNWLVAAGIDGTEKGVNLSPWSGSYRGFKENFAAGIGWLA